MLGRAVEFRTYFWRQRQQIPIMALTKGLQRGGLPTTCTNPFKINVIFAPRFIDFFLKRLLPLYQYMRFISTKPNSVPGVWEKKKVKIMVLRFLPERQEEWRTISEPWYPEKGTVWWRSYILFWIHSIKSKLLTVALKTSSYTGSSPTVT